MTSQDWRTAKPERKAERKATAEDKLRAEIHGAARQEAVKHLKALLEEDTNLLIKTLKPHEVDGLVEAVIRGYITKTQEIEFREDLNRDEIRKIALKTLDNFV